MENPLRIEYKKFIKKNHKNMLYFSKGLGVSKAYCYRLLSDGLPVPYKNLEMYSNFLRLMEKNEDEVLISLTELNLYYSKIKKQNFEYHLKSFYLPLNNKENKITIPFDFKLKGTSYELQFRKFIDTLTQNPKALSFLTKVLEAFLNEKDKPLS